MGLGEGEGLIISKVVLFKAYSDIASLEHKASVPCQVRHHLASNSLLTSSLRSEDRGSNLGGHLCCWKPDAWLEEKVTGVRSVCPVRYPPLVPGQLQCYLLIL